MNAAQFPVAAFGRAWRSIRTVPRPRDWGEAALAASALAATIGPLGFATGLLHWRPRSAVEILPMAGLALLVPAFGEELLFRGAWIPGPKERGRGGVAIALTTVAFTAWHVLETLWLPKAAGLFTRPDFLAWAALLGLACAILRRRSGSLWPAVALHWIAVVIWQGWLGGPDAAALR